MSLPINDIVYLFLLHMYQLIKLILKNFIYKKYLQKISF